MRIFLWASFHFVRDLTPEIFAVGIIENGGFIPGQIVWTENGEQFLPGQVIETSEGLKFVPGEVIETQSGSKFIPGQTIQTPEGRRFIPGERNSARFGLRFTDLMQCFRSNRSDKSGSNVHSGPGNLHRG